MKNLQEKTGTAIIMITHDLGVVANMADRVAVMYAGEIVEMGTVDEIFYKPKHPYTLGLLQSMPKLHSSRKVPLIPIPGSPPNLAKKKKTTRMSLCIEMSLYDESMSLFCTRETPNDR